MQYGGTLSHHHGVGKLRSPFMKCINSDTFQCVLKNIKQAFDPENVFVGNGGYSDEKGDATNEHDSNQIKKQIH